MLRAKHLVLSLALLIPTVGEAQQATNVAAGPTVEQVTRAKIDGELAAQTIGTGGWFGGGLASGVLLGLIGTGVTWAIAGASNVSLPPETKLQVASQPLVVQTAFESAYQSKVKQKRKSAALKGGLVGTAAFVALVLVNSGN